MIKNIPIGFTLIINLLLVSGLTFPSSLKEKLFLS